MAGIYARNDTERAVYALREVEYARATGKLSDDDYAALRSAYTAEAVNQQATPAVDYLLKQGYKKFYLLGSDYVYPQTTNLVLLEYLLSKSVPIENIGGGLKSEGGKVISAGVDGAGEVASLAGKGAHGLIEVAGAVGGALPDPSTKQEVIDFAMARHRYRGRATTNVLVFLPMATPEVVMGSSLLTLFVSLQMPLGATTILIAHIMFCLSFVVVTVRASTADGTTRLSVSDSGIGIPEVAAAQRSPSTHVVTRYS